MRRRLAIALLVLLLLVPLRSTLAWNKAGHMVIGAIAYERLKQTNPRALGKLIELLKQHPRRRLWRPTYRPVP